jgi:hypothetical protein
MAAASAALTGWRKSMPATTPTKSGRAGLAGVMVTLIISSCGRAEGALSGKHSAEIATLKRFVRHGPFMPEGIHV